MKTLTLLDKTKKKFYILLDDDDFERVSKEKWYIRNMKKKGLVYAARLISNFPKKKWELMHRFLIKTEKGLVIDHKNGNGIDNRKRNLRVCTVSENVINSKKYHREKERAYLPRGVTVFRYFSKKRGLVTRYTANITKNRVKKYLGIFDTMTKARIAYINAANSLHGKFSRQTV